MGGQRSRGKYVYRVDGRAADVEETWEIVELGSERRTRSLRRVPASRTTLSVESIHRDGDWAQCALTWCRAADAGEVRVTAAYRFHEGGIEIRRRDPAGESETLRADPAATFSPLLRIYAGDVIHRLCQRGQGRVLVPWIGDPVQEQRLFRPEYSERRVRRVGEDRIAVDGMPVDCIEYEYSGGPYVPGARFWVHASGVLLRYRWRQGDGREWDVHLRDWRTDAAETA